MAALVVRLGLVEHRRSFLLLLSYLDLSVGVHHNDQSSLEKVVFR